MEPSVVWFLRDMMELPEILRVTVDGKIGPVGILLLLLDVCGILL